MQEHLIKLDDQRTIEVLEQGDPAGRSMLYLHGAPGSCHERSGFEEEYQQLGLRFISVSRPGTGASSSHEGWNALSFADDMRQFLDYLEIDSVTVIGFSAGGLYGCAFACRYPERVEKLALLSSAAPFDQGGNYAKHNDASRQLYDAAIQCPDALLQQLSGVVTTEDVLRLMESMVHLVDLRILALPKVRNSLLASFSDVLKQGMESAVKEAANFASPWGFSTADISVETHIWQGTVDQNVPLAFGEYLAETIPSASVTFVDGAGHYFSFEQWPELLRALSAKD